MHGKAEVIITERKRINIRGLFHGWSSKLIKKHR